MNKQPLNSNSFESAAKFFLDKLALNLAQLKIKDYWNIDHICWRVSENYFQVKNDFLSFSDLIGEEIVNGRPISTFKLHKPLMFNNQTIPLVEVPAPKNNQTLDGFEHIEIVIDEPFETFTEQNPHFNYKSSGLQKVYNKELVIQFENMSIKLHHQSLNSVIQLESKKRVYNTTVEVLKLLEKFNPLVCGTFPLNINTEKSDIDILVSHSNLELMYGELTNLLKNQKNFSSQIQNDHFTIQFLSNNIPIEIFGEKTPTVKQRAYKHYLLEERILKIANERFQIELINLRNSGIKTEPAFAQLLKLSGNPYEKLLEIYEYNEIQLKELLQTSGF